LPADRRLGDRGRHRLPAGCALPGDRRRDPAPAGPGRHRRLDLVDGPDLARAAGHLRAAGPAPAERPRARDRVTSRGWRLHAYPAAGVRTRGAPMVDEGTPVATTGVFAALDCLTMNMILKI